MPTPVCHIEINVKNMARAKKFYSKLFGWKFKPMMPTYQVFSLGHFGGALTTAKVGKSSILPYFSVKSVDATLKQAAKMKAKIAMKRTEIEGDMGCFAHIKDSEGNTVGVWSQK